MGLTKLSEYPPTEPGLLEVAQPDWLACPCGLTRESNALTRANFDAMCDKLDDIDPNGKDWEIVRFNHWKVGWLEVIFVRPDTKVARIALETRYDLGKYPCLNEDLWVEYEVEDMGLAEAAKTQSQEKKL